MAFYRTTTKQQSKAIGQFGSRLVVRRERRFSEACQPTR